MLFQGGPHRSVDSIGRDCELFTLRATTLARLDPMNGLTAFGLLAVTAMLITYALEPKSRWFVLGFAGACALGSVYGFLQGAWPFGLIEAIWSLVALRRWQRAADRNTSN
jgi:hypothetical protein